MTDWADLFRLFCFLAGNSVTLLNSVTAMKPINTRIVPMLLRIEKYIDTYIYIHIYTQVYIYNII